MAPDTRSLESALPTDQASILQDLANGAAASACATDGDTEDLNGADSNLDYLFEDDEDDTYPIAGLDNSFQEELGDPAALLESLANYEPAPSLVVESRAPPLLNDHDHFESLLQAAATAVGVEVSRENYSQVGDSFEFFDHFDTYGYFKRSIEALDTSKKRKRGLENASHDDSKMLIREPSKRRKKDVEEDAEQLALERELWGPEEGEDADDTSSTSAFPPVPTAGARAAGLHSATALFRRPSTASKKYTRAPMSKLFTSLELTAEQFLRLQAAAKTYMLDPTHPERSNCVGNRGKAESDMLKLEVFACVKSFLEDEGWGQRYFTEDVEGGRFRKLKWPQMKNKIIALVTPLMRRMVTNERQRLYALETRQVKRTKGPSGRPARLSQTPTAQGTPQLESRRIEGVTPTRHQMVDPKLNDYHYKLDLTCHTNGNGQTNEITGPKEPGPSIAQEVGGKCVAIKYLVNLVHHGRRVHPQVTLTQSSCPGFASLVQHINNMMDSISQGQQTSSMKVLGPTGLINVKDEESWRGAVASVKQTEWLDGEVKCVVQVVEAS